MNYDPIRHVYVDAETGDIIPAAEGDDLGDVQLYDVGIEAAQGPASASSASSSQNNNNAVSSNSTTQMSADPSMHTHDEADEDEDLKLALALQEEEQARLGDDSGVGVGAGAGSSLGASAVTDYTTLMHNPPVPRRSRQHQQQRPEQDDIPFSFPRLWGNGRAALVKQMQTIGRSKKKKKVEEMIPETAPDAVVERLAAGDRVETGIAGAGGGVAGLLAPSSNSHAAEIDTEIATSPHEQSSLYREALEAEARATADDWSIARAMQMAEMEIDNEMYQREGGDFRDKELRGTQCCRQLKTISTLLCVLQILFLVVMVQDDGYAPSSENPMMGPPGTTMVRYGAKFAAMIKYEHEWWRLFSPIMLHAGIVHLISNVAIQLRIGGYLNLVFGWKRWLAIYVGSGVYGNMLSCVFLTDAVGVGSSGAVLGMLTSWLLWIIFRWNKIPKNNRNQRNCQLILVTVAVAFTLAMSFSNLVDWAAHFGGAIMGVLLGAFLLAKELDRDATKIGMKVIGGGLALGLFVVTLVYMIAFMKPSKDLLPLFDANDDWKHFPHKDND